MKLGMFTKLMRTKEIHISASTYISSSPIFYFARLWGVAPYSIRKNGSNFLLKWSPLYTVYSFIFALIFVFGSLRGLMLNQKGSHLKGEYVFYFSTYLGNIATIALIFGAPLRAPKLYRYIQYMNEIDSILQVNDSKKTRYLSLATLCIIFIGITMQVSASMYFMAMRKPVYILHFLPDNIQQTFILIMFECQYAHMVYCVERRFKILNHCLKCSDNSQLNGLHNSLNIQFSDNYGLQLAKVYSRLCDAVDKINEAFSYSVVIIVMIVLIKLTVSMYFLIFMMLQNYPFGSKITQVSWNFFDILRLIIIIEPCDRCLNEISNVSVTVSKLLGFNSQNNHFKQQMEILLKHLQYRKCVFSVAGFGTLNHRFLTNFFSAVTTYLVIVIQFNQSYNS